MGLHNLPKKWRERAHGDAGLSKDLRDPINAFHWPLHIVSAEASSPRKVNPFRPLVA